MCDIVYFVESILLVLVCVVCVCVFVCVFFFFFQAEDGIRDLVRSRGLGDVYKRQVVSCSARRIPRQVVGVGVRSR